VKKTGYEVHRYAILSTIRLPPLLGQKHPPQHSVLKNAQSVCFNP